MKQKFIEWFTKNNNGCSPAMEDDRSFVCEKTQHMFEAYQAGVAEGEARCAALAAENAYLLPKAASELSNAWVLHKYLIGIQAAIMYLDNGNKKAAQEWLYGTIAGPGFEFPDEVEDIDAWATHQMRGSISHPQAIEIIKAETPATDAFLAEVRAQGVEMFGQWLRDSADIFDKNSRHDWADQNRVSADKAGEFAAQLRQEAAQ
ncbi:hypothetical protein ACNQ05_24260 [Enterobacter cloacae complex sp.6701062]|uniref:hypothetical protein n=1 Tax=unclassified Enterobacter cloacae complex TaxID=2757714 RepID=UPI003AABBF1D